MAKQSSKKLRGGSWSSSPHHSFKRTYREDYVRELNVPGMGQHLAESFRMIVWNAKLFLPLLAIAAVLEILVIGATYETTMVFSVLIFLMIWLVTIYLVRHRMAGHEVTLRDGLYNAMTPLLSSLVVFVVGVIQCVPIFLLIIAYAAAIKTEFLAMPFYALLFLGFAGLMLVLSGYLLSSTLIALVAVSAPGLYPLKALATASELMMGRRIRFVLRVIALILVLVAMMVVLVLPLAVLKVPVEILSVVMAIVGCFYSIYATVYLYLYYRYLLDV